MPSVFSKNLEAELLGMVILLLGGFAQTVRLSNEIDTEFAEFSEFRKRLRS